MTTNEIPIACNMEAIPEAQRGQHESSTRAIFAQVQQIKELKNGYQLVFPVELLVPLAEFIALERRCCPFFVFTLNVEQGSEQVLLMLGGREGVKDYIRQIIQDDLGS